MEREDLPDGVRLSDARGELVIRRPAKNVELLRGTGYGSEHFVDSILENRERIVRECGSIVIFDDLQKVTGYDAKVRLALTDWARGHKKEIVALQILVRSRIVQMGVTVANLALGGHIRAHVVRATFEAELERAIEASK